MVHIDGSFCGSQIDPINSLFSISSNPFIVEQRHNANLKFKVSSVVSDRAHFSRRCLRYFTRSTASAAASSPAALVLRATHSAERDNHTIGRTILPFVNN